MNNLTPWFYRGTKPARPGVYETELFDPVQNEFHGRGYSLWNGHQWSDSRPDVNWAAGCKVPGSQGKRWRGLTEEQK